MDLKNAVAVCLISLVSATLVMLIARAQDMQAASRLEPQLAQIAEELQAIRQQGGFAAASGDVQAGEVLDDALVVYYFHGNVRCVTCRAIETQAHETVQSDFASQLASEEIVWKKLNYEDAATADLAKQFAIQVPVVVLAKMESGQVANWRRLDKVWALVGDRPAFAELIRTEIGQMLSDGGPKETSTSVDNDGESSASETVPDDPPVDDIPIP